MLDAAVLIPALPLAGFLVLCALGSRLRGSLAGWVGTLAMAGSFAATLVVFAGLLERDSESRSFTQTLFEWIPSLGVDVALLVDPLSVTMALFVTGVGTLIHLYSIGYMKGDPRFARFFTYLNLFAFSMLVLVLADSYLLSFLGWEGVGACSYLLISFWFERDSAASAGKKAFVTNRIGDVGFMCAMFLLFGAMGSVRYVDVFAGASTMAQTTLAAVGFLLLLGAAGKSAQLPLYVWLPDAMEGPTPVSALIHAATMVTAGVYLFARSAPLLALAPDEVGTVVAILGAATALFAATVAVAQNDIKRVLAYSTISQLGYMFLAVGTGAYVAAIFHMVTHAFFKALLFLGSGSVIHGLHDEQDMQRMGGLRKWMPVTAATFIIGWLAIAGVPPFAGFWSKDDILLAAYQEHVVLWAVGLLTALLTAYYMTRQVVLVFFGDERWRNPAPVPAVPEGDGEEVAAAHAAGSPVADSHGHHGDPHESPWTMLVPLVVLAGLSVLGGALNLPFHGAEQLHHWLEPVFGDALAQHEPSSGLRIGLALAATAAGVVGIAIALSIFARARRVEAGRPGILQRAWGIDSALASFFGGPGRAAADGAASFDSGVIDGAVNGVATLVQRSSTGLRTTQTGFVRNYALGITAGLVLMLAFFVVRMAA